MKIVKKLEETPTFEPNLVEQYLINYGTLSKQSILPMQCGRDEKSEMLVNRFRD
jgi:hypothetical protein